MMQFNLRSVVVVSVGMCVAWLMTEAIVAHSAVAAPASNLVCTFAQGVAGSYDDGAFASKQASSLSFKVHNIDLEKQTATLVKKEGAKGRQVRIVRAINANHFLEVVNEGFLNLTTIYDLDSKTNSYPAVHSRHFGVLGQPLFAQYTGMCEKL